MATLDIKEMQVACKAINVTGVRGEIACIAKLMEMSEGLMIAKKKRANYEIFETHCDVHGSDKLQEAYEYSFKNTVEEQLADIIIVTLTLANELRIDLTSVILARMASKVDELENGKAF